MSILLRRAVVSSIYETAVCDSKIKKYREDFKTMSTSLLLLSLTEPHIESDRHNNNGNILPPSLVDDLCIDENSTAKVLRSRIHSGTNNIIKRACSYLL